MTEFTDGRRGYHAYGDFVHWKNSRGEPMPHWNKLPEQVRGAWEHQARVIIRASRRAGRAPELRVHLAGFGSTRTRCGMVKGGMKTTDDIARVTCGRCKRVK